MTVEPNSNYANVSWRHNFPAGSSEFVLELTLDSKNQTEPGPEPSSPGRGRNPLWSLGPL